MHIFIYQLRLHWRRTRSVVRPRRCRSAAAYSDQTFPWTICPSVRWSLRRSVGLSSALWKNGGSDPGAVWLHRSDGTRRQAGIGVWGIGPREGVLLGSIFASPL